MPPVLCRVPALSAMMPDCAFEVGHGYANLVVRPRLGAGCGVKPEVGPQRRAHESHVIDVDHARVEQLDSVVSALARELEPRGVDFGPVPLVIAGDVQQVRVVPRAHHLADAMRTHRGEIPCEDDDVGGGNRGEGFTRELDVEVGEDSRTQATPTTNGAGTMTGIRSSPMRPDDGKRREWLHGGGSDEMQNETRRRSARVRRLSLDAVYCHVATA